MTCPRCAGFVVEEWDPDASMAYTRCLNCGARPGLTPYRADGQPIDAPLLCYECKKRPRLELPSGRRVTDSRMCAECRIQYNHRQKTYKRNKKAKAA